MVAVLGVTGVLRSSSFMSQDRPEKWASLCHCSGGDFIKGFEGCCAMRYKAMCWIGGWGGRISMRSEH